MDTKKSHWSFCEDMSSAFQKDCDNLLSKFEALESYNYKDFSKLFRSMQFYKVYAEQSNKSIIFTLTGNYFHIVKKYIVFRKNVYTQLGGFYLLYALYYTQPVKEWVKIRLVYDDFKAIVELLFEMREKKMYEPCFIFYKLKLEDAFQFVATRKPCGCEPRFVRDSEKFENDTFESCSKGPDCFDQFKDVYANNIDKLKDTEDEYKTLLNAFATEHPCMAQFNSTFVDDFTQSYLQTFYPEPTKSEDSGDEESSRINEVKKRAMGGCNAVYRGERKVTTAVDLELNCKKEKKSDS